ncbi:MAG: DNA repair protein RecN [Actinomycetales bacterium]|nr:MAG: DNA repair protein RecN [Actinomycetales bacterium]
MLTQLRITGLGVIDDARLQLHPGLTVLTGETGAGKTMVVQGLGLLLGARADSSLVRTGHQATAVEGILTLADGHPARERAVDAGGQLDDDELVLVRTVSAEGRSRAHVGGRAAPIGALAELGQLLVAVHGQADQWRLRHAEEHRDLLDTYGGPDLTARRAAFERAYAALREARMEHDRLTALERDRTRETDLLTAGLEHIESIGPEPNEDMTLRAEDERLAHAEGLRQAALHAQALVAGPDDPGVTEGAGMVELCARARDLLGSQSRHDPRLGELETRATETGYLLADLGADLARYLADLDVDPARLAWVQQRRADLATLTRRYGATIDDVLAWSQQAADRLTELAHVDDRLGQLDQQLDQLQAHVDTAATALTAARRAAAGRFETAVTEELSHLAMGRSRLQVNVTPGGLGPTGADDVEIRLAANAGDPPRSLARAASGGELSRVMLAIEVVSATADVDPAAPRSSTPLPTFVFDEVDAGVGGAAALDVGARLAALARHTQVVVVTHLAQVAAYADRHLVVRKTDFETAESITESSVVEVAGEARLQELARMMGGDDSRAGRAHAVALLEQVSGGDGADGTRTSPSAART